MSAFIEKKKVLLQQMEKAKKAMKEIRAKRVLELGELAIDSGLEDIGNEQLKAAFVKIAQGQV